MNSAENVGVAEGGTQMRWQPMQLELDVEAHHRALRRCHSCGAYARNVEETGGAIRCERCAQRARRERDDADEDLNASS
jgi:formylmethanofuran dehydrogenase subunit E